jgi:hypothetical protein
VASGPTWYLDLDTLVVDDISDLLSYRGEFAILRDFYRLRKAMQSAVMAWTPGPHTDALYERFVTEPDAWMRRLRSDQDYIERIFAGEGFEPDRLQDLHPDQFVSLKVHARAGCPPGARLVCFHGTPRPNDPAAGWAHREWVNLARAS